MFVKTSREIHLGLIHQISAGFTAEIKRDMRMTYLLRLKFKLNKEYKHILFALKLNGRSLQETSNFKDKMSRANIANSRIFFFKNNVPENHPASYKVRGQLWVTG